MQRIFKYGGIQNTNLTFDKELNIMQEAIASFVPCRSVVTGKSKPLWMTTKVLRNVRKKHKLWKKWRESADDNAEQKYVYKKQANKASKVVRLAKRDFERKIAKNIKKTLSLSLNMSDQRPGLRRRLVHYWTTMMY